MPTIKTASLFIALVALMVAPLRAETLRIEPARVFDGQVAHDNWIVIVRDEIDCVCRASRRCTRD